VSKTISFKFPAGKQRHIMVAENAFSRKVASGLVDECNRYFDRLFQPGVTLGGLNPMVKNSSDMNFSRSFIESRGVDSSNFAFYENEVSVGLYSAVGHYIQQYEELWKWPNPSDTGYRLQRYFRNVGFYRTHIDGAAWDPIPGYGPRVLGAVIYLNDVKVGGSTYFPEHDLHVPAKAGSISLFPTSWTHPHMGQTPLSEDKWMISTFMVCTQNQHEEPIEPPFYSDQKEESEESDATSENS